MSGVRRASPPGGVGAGAGSSGSSQAALELGCSRARRCHSASICVAAQDELDLPPLQGARGAHVRAVIREERVVFPGALVGEQQAAGIGEAGECGGVFGHVGPRVLFQSPTLYHTICRAPRGSATQNVPIRLGAHSRQRRTPGPSPAPPMNSTPAASRVSRMSFRFAGVACISEPEASILLIVLALTELFIASSATDQFKADLASRI